MNAKQIIYLFLFFLSCNFAVFSQALSVDYYNKNWQKTKGEDRYYKREIYKEHDSLYLVKDFYLSNSIEMTGYFKSLDDQKKHGHFIFYYGGGEKRIEGDYSDGIICGKWFVYNKEGEIINTLNYDFEIPSCPRFDTSLNAYLKRDSLNYIVVDFMPRFIHEKYESFDEYIHANLFIAPLINKYKIKDKAKAKFTIDKKGYLCGIEVTSMIGNKTIIKEVTRVLVNAPKWVPATSNRLAVPVDFVMPVKIE